MNTYDAKWVDSNLSYFVNQLDSFDKTLHEPLYSVTWSRDIKLRTDISMGNQSTSFTRSSYAGVGTQVATGKPWISDQTTTIPGVDVNGERIVTPLRPLAREIVYSSIELDRSRLIGQSIDLVKMDAFNMKYQMDTDEMVYVGDTFVGATGLVNSPLVATATVANGALGSPLWEQKTPDEILADINEMLNAAWQDSGFTQVPRELRLPPKKFAYIQNQKVSTAADKSILNFLRDNSLSNSVNGAPLNIQPLKWLTATADGGPGPGVGGANRMIAYTNEQNRLRFPMVPVRRENTYYHGINFHAPYVWAMGEVEILYPETIAYRDGF